MGLLWRRPWGEGIVQTIITIFIMLAAGIAVAGFVLYERGRWRSK